MQIIDLLQPAMVVVVLGDDRSRVGINKCLDAFPSGRIRTKVECCIGREFKAVTFGSRAEALDKVIRPRFSEDLQQRLKRQSLSRRTHGSMSWNFEHSQFGYEYQNAARNPDDRKQNSSDQPSIEMNVKRPAAQGCLSRT